MRHRARATAVGARATAVAAAGAAVVALLAGCASGRGAGAGPTWVPQPQFTLEPNPVQPGTSPSGNTTAPTSPSSPRPSASSSGPQADPAVVASGLSAPVGIAVLPDGTALVGERTTGRIVRVQPLPGKPVTVVRTIFGLDAAGDGGLLDLAASPAYDEDGLIYAYITTATDNRVVDFTLTGPVTPVLTGIPKGPTGNAGRIAFDVDGSLLIGTGDAGQPTLAQDPASLAGKVLDVTDIGQPASSGSPVFNAGHHDLAGLCVDPGTAVLFDDEQGSAGAPDEVNQLVAHADYGWPITSATSRAPIVTMTAQESGVGGCAVADGVFYVTSLDGRELLAATISRSATTVKLGAFTASLTAKYGRLITVVAAPDGSLWLATSNRDGHGVPIAADERILHIEPSGGGASSQA